MASLVPDYVCDQIRKALEESDRLDALVDRASSVGSPTVSEEEYDLLRVQQQAMWALVRHLVLDAADTTDYKPPVCVDIGDAVIIVYSCLDHGDGVRDMDAGWAASRRIVRPAEIPAWATEPETDDDDDNDDDNDNFAFKLGNN